MKPGDTVITHDGEVGVIDHAASPDHAPYDWWVNIASKNVVMCIPYRESELCLKGSVSTH
jgi:hypothetical protein